MFVRPSHKSTVEGAKRNVIALDKKVVEEDEKEDDEEEPQSSQSFPLSKLRRRRDGLPRCSLGLAKERENENPN